jgi:phosphomannomutase
MICDIVNGFKVLKEKGFTVTQTIEKNIEFAKEYMQKHYNEFENIVRYRGNINPFYDKQDKEFYNECLKL